MALHELGSKFIAYCWSWADVDELAVLLGLYAYYSDVSTRDGKSRTLEW